MVEWVSRAAVVERVDGQSGAARDAEQVPEVVDPSPIIQEKLRALAAEHEPKIAELDAAVAAADRKAARLLRADRRRAKRSYRKARRVVEKLRTHRAAW
jgi:hypothetical protein